jgi:hypothetical protein
MEYPNTYKRIPNDNAANFPDVFDPSMKQFSRAFRQGEPSFADQAIKERWHAARRRLLGQLLKAVGDSPWRDNLVMRGSMLMKLWFGESAREPGDIDWVVRPLSIEIHHRWTSDLFVVLARIAKERSTTERAGVTIDDVRMEDIWTYDRVPGRRIVYYWHADDTPTGTVQMDFVFGEELWAPPVQNDFFADPANRSSLWTATRELSLAWKLLWLDTDQYPQGKDLYDAVLLAESTPISVDLIKLALADRLQRLGDRQLAPDFPLQWQIDWQNFKIEYPWVPGESSDWQKRLVSALKPTFADM